MADIKSFFEGRESFDDWANRFTEPYNATLINTDNNILNKPEEKEEIKIPNPRDVKSFLDQYVIGQEEAKRVLSVAVHNHYVRIARSNKENDVEIEKSNVLLIGKSGSGKTLLAQTIAKYLDVPFVSVDITSFTPSGIVGKDVESIGKMLIDKADGNVERAEHGIVYIDEIDKISSNSTGNVTSGVKGVLGGETQAALLKVLEGTELEEHSNGGSWFGSYSTSKLNTKNVLFICGGAFAGIDFDYERKQEFTKTIGFGSCGIQTIENEFKEVTSDDLIKYGMMPELLGRLPVMVQLHPLTRNDLVKILIEPKNSLLRQYKTLLEEEGIAVDFTEDALYSIADIAIKRKLGARGLRGVVDKVMTNVIFEIPDDVFTRKCIITKECIENNIIPEFEKTII